MVYLLVCTSFHTRKTPKSSLEIWFTIPSSRKHKYEAKMTEKRKGLPASMARSQETSSRVMMVCEFLGALTALRRLLIGICSTCMQCWQIPEEGPRHVEPPSQCWKLNSVSLQEQPALSPGEETCQLTSTSYLIILFFFF